MAEKKLPKGISIRKDGRYQARYTLNGKRYTIIEEKSRMWITFGFSKNHHTIFLTKIITIA